MLNSRGGDLVFGQNGVEKGGVDGGGGEDPDPLAGEFGRFCEPRAVRRGEHRDVIMQDGEH